MTRRLPAISLWVGCVFIAAAAFGSGSSTSKVAAAVSRSAADSCAQKVRTLEEHAAKPGKKKKQNTRISEEEINSYLAYELSSKYHPSLKSIVVDLEEAKLHGVAAINFDHVNKNSTRFLKKLLARMFAGEHELSVKGALLARAGKVSFQVHEARFDGTPLPIILVEEIMSIVGRNQKPPIDPTQPSQLPYGIQSVEVHSGYIIIHQ